MKTKTVTLTVPHDDAALIVQALRHWAAGRAHLADQYGNLGTPFREQAERGEKLAERVAEAATLEYAR